MLGSLSILYHLGPAAAAGHGAAEKDVNEEHQTKEDSECNTEVCEPARVEISHSADSITHCAWPGHK